MSPHTDAGALLPCPFCGGKPYVHGPDNPGHEYWISCQSCQASSVMRSNHHAARSAWNARHPAQASLMPLEKPDGWIVKNRTGGVELFLDHDRAIAAFSAWGSSIGPLYASPVPSAECK